jgi:uncharacterized membrane protein YjgN (DUF898 family)
MSANTLDIGLSAVGAEDRIAPDISAGNNDVRTMGTDLSPLVLRGLLLTIVTLGIYRFWYKTDLRRWYWRNTVVGGSALEYRGTAKELFIGFLIALAVVMPLYGVVFTLGLFATETVNQMLNPLLGALFVLLVQYGAFRSRRYRLTRTVWRGVRFDQSGSAVTYALRSLGWLVVTILSLGLAFPWMRRSLERYRIEHTHFGSAKGSFAAPIGPLLKRWLAIALPVMFLLGIGGYEAAKTAVWIPGLNQYRISGFATFFLLMGILWPLLLWPAYRVAEFRLFTGGTKLGPVSFVSAFQTKRMYGLYLKLLGLFLGGLILLVMLVLFILPHLVRSGGYISVVALLVLPYLAGFLFFSWLKEIIVNQGFWRHASAMLAINNLAAAEDVLGGSVRDEAATGEGFADALDFGGV